jgi:hypothetical protein
MEWHCTLLLNPFFVRTSVYNEDVPQLNCKGRNCVKLKEHIWACRWIWNMTYTLDIKILGQHSMNMTINITILTHRSEVRNLYWHFHSQQPSGARYSNFIRGMQLVRCYPMTTLKLFKTQLTRISWPPSSQVGAKGGLLSSSYFSYTHLTADISNCSVYNVSTAIYTPYTRTYINYILFPQVSF